MFFSQDAIVREKRMRSMREHVERKDKDGRRDTDKDEVELGKRVLTVWR